MSPQVIPDIEPIRFRLQAAAPEGWYVHPATMDLELAPRANYPTLIYEVEVQTRRAAGTRGRYQVGRSASMTIRAASVDALEAAIKALPALDAFLGLPLDTEVRFGSYDD